jgi:alkanesulfonate monooxygenase SsuD/methylene tetrahydromethanopterin reductase-like flavin-dependent oxidoreductase (luciferase family)
MKAGVVYPQTELGGDTGAIKAFAQAAEDLGYDHIVIYDHVLGAVHEGREPKLTGPYKENDPFHGRWSPTLTSPVLPRTSD